MAQFGFKAMLLIAAIFRIIGSIVFVLIDRKNRIKNDWEEKSRNETTFRRSLGIISGLIIAVGLFTWIFIIDHLTDIFLYLSQTLQVLFYEEVVGVSVTQIGNLSAIAQLIALLVTIPLGYWVDKRGEHIGLGLAYLLFAFQIGFVLIATDLMGLIPAAIINPFSMGLAIPAYQSLISKAVPEDQRGIAFGLVVTSRGLIALPAPYIGGLLWDKISPKTPFLVTIFGFLGLSILALIKLKNPNKLLPKKS